MPFVMYVYDQPFYRWVSATMRMEYSTPSRNFFYAGCDIHVRAGYENSMGPIAMAVYLVVYGGKRQNQGDSQRAPT